MKNTHLSNRWDGDVYLPLLADESRRPVIDQADNCWDISWRSSSK